MLDGDNPNRWRGFGHGSFIAAAITIASADAEAQIILGKQPILGVRLPHQEPQAAASFGWTMVMGKFGIPGIDIEDDLLVSSIFFDLTTSSGNLDDIGRVYAYDGPNLSAHGADNRLNPGPTQQKRGTNFGRLHLELSDLRGTTSAPQANQAFVAAAFRTKSQTCGGQSQNVDNGAIDVFDLSASSGTISLLYTIDPPLDPGSSSDACRIRLFGHGFTSGDIDGDGYKDLVVGAPASDDATTSDPSDGRVYVFFGHPNFGPATSSTTGYLFRWMLLYPPALSSSSSGFGYNLAADHFDEDGYAEIAVCRPEKAVGAGRAHLFRGAWLRLQAPPSTGGSTIVRPTTPAQPNDGVAGEYETLVDPNPGAQNPSSGYGFHVFTFPGRDLGGVGYGTSSPRRDLVVHSEASPWVSVSGSERRAGANFVYYGNNDPTNANDTTLVEESTPTKLVTPLNTGFEPQTGERFGRGCGLVEWEDANGATIHLLLCGAPDRDVGLPTNPDDLIEDAGIVFAFRVPIDGPNGTDHALAGGPLYEPADHIIPGLGQMLQAGPKRHGRFGAWIVTGKYTPEFEHDQFVICARERPLGTSTLVGQVYAFTMQ